jgi:hypothetical protein
VSITLFCDGNWVTSSKVYCLPLSVFMGEDHHLCAKSPHTRKWKNHCTLVRESLMLEARGSSNMVNMVNSVCSLQEYCLSYSVFMGEEHHLFEKSPHSSEWKKNCSCCYRIIVRSKRV